MVDAAGEGERTREPKSVRGANEGGSRVCSPSRAPASVDGRNRTPPQVHLVGENRARHPIPIMSLSETHDLSASPSPARTYPAIGGRRFRNHSVMGATPEFPLGGV